MAPMIGRLHLETASERLNDPGPSHTVVAPPRLISYLPHRKRAFRSLTHDLTTVYTTVPLSTVHLRLYYPLVHSACLTLPPLRSSNAQTASQEPS